MYDANGNISCQAFLLSFTSKIVITKFAFERIYKEIVWVPPYNVGDKMIGILLRRFYLTSCELDPTTMFVNELRSDFSRFIKSVHCFYFDIRHTHTILFPFVNVIMESVFAFVSIAC